MNYFIADLHFGHTNALSFDNRPFTDIKVHDNEIIKRNNDVVEISDDLYILGDISWYNATETIKLLNQMNGRKHLIIGNHDNKLLKSRELRDLFVEITDYKELHMDDGKGIVLSHYPIPCFKNHYYGWYHLYGHVHSSFEWNMMENVKRNMIELYEVPCNMYNVGAMMNYIEYTPRTLDEILKSNKEE